MWKEKKNLKANVIMETEYEDFASLKVLKKVQNNIVNYILTINIYSIVSEELSFYKMDDLTKILKYVKSSIEYFYDNINDMDDDEYNSFIDDFLAKINEY